jgi:hypothetical protein
MNLVSRTAIESAAAEILEERIDLDRDKVAAVLANEIVTESIDDLMPSEDIEAGVRAAIEEIDEAAFSFAVDVIRDCVAAEVEGQAKAIALRMLRETAAKGERAAACSVEGGI